MFRARLNVDSEAEFDIDDNEACALALSLAAQEVTREGYVLPVWEAALTLVADQAEYVLTTACAADLIFEAEEIHVNGNWLQRLLPQDFRRAVGDYHTESSHSKPGFWTPVGPDKIRISQPPNSTAVAASDNFVKGWALHPLYTFGQNNDDPFLGPVNAHQLYVDRAVLDNSVGNVASQEGMARRREIERKYSLRINGGRDANGQEVQGLKNQNLELYKPLMRQHRAGSRRRFFGIGNPR